MTVRLRKHNNKKNIITFIITVVHFTFSVIYTELKIHIKELKDENYNLMHRS